MFLADSHSKRIHNAQLKYDGYRFMCDKCSTHHWLWGQLEFCCQPPQEEVPEYDSSTDEDEEPEDRDSNIPSELDHRSLSY